MLPSQNGKVVIFTLKFATFFDERRIVVLHQSVGEPEANALLYSHKPAVSKINFMRPTLNKSSNLQVFVTLTIGETFSFVCL